MQELINKIKENTGVTDEQAKKSIETVSEYLKTKMPKSFHSQIDNMITGGKLSEGIKEKLMDVAVEAKDKTEEALKDIYDKIEEVAKNIREKLDNKKPKE